VTGAAVQVSDCDRTNGGGRFGAPKQSRLRESFAVALRVLWDCRDKKKYQGGFCKWIARVVEIKCARRPFEYKTCFVTDNDLRQNLKRGFKDADIKQVVTILRALVEWRHNREDDKGNPLDPQWGFLIGTGSPPACVIVTPKNPEAFFEWIDAAVERSKADDKSR
jgi:hypothetical protein